MEKIIRRSIVLLSLFSLIFVQKIAGQNNTSENNEVNQKAIKELISRVLPKDAGHFKVEIIANENGKDVFEIESKERDIILRGNNGISIASALNYYIKNIAHCDISWNGTNLNLPHPLPLVPQKIHELSPYKYRYYFNYCTFNYTASWWDWERWQKEIDFMALNGINLPLALTGQNAVWERVYKSMGLNDKELESFFSGPAYFSWFWMGNLDGYGGPLPKSWMKNHEELQKKILQRERELGMNPVLPAFSGHVPPAIKEKFPNMKLIKTIWDQNGFDPVYSIDPSDTMFTYIGRKFLAEQTKTYGTNHFYSSDTFNENEPPSNDSTFLSGVSQKVYQSMTQVDTGAIWVMQGWLFYSHANFWKQPQIKALLGAVPNDKMIVLDLWSEVHPVWDRTEAYYGKTWIWCMLHNFGGKIGMFGEVNNIANSPLNSLHDSKSGNMAGIGITAEGIEQNPAVYELMLDNAWRNNLINSDQWIKEYIIRRYGQQNDNAEKAWDVLLNTVYGKNSVSGTESIILARPALGTKTTPAFPNIGLPYTAGNLLPAWDDFIAASDKLHNRDGFKYDLVDVSRQVLANYSNDLYKKFINAYYDKNITDVKKYGSQFLALIDDMDKLVATRKDFLLGKWLNASKKWGTNAEEKKLYEKNARDLITLWGDKNNPLHDYARKQWAGLLKDFYKPRWAKFIQYVITSVENNRTFDQVLLDKELKDLEWKWVNSNQSYSDKPVGDPVTVSKEIYKKYSQAAKEAAGN